MPRSWRIRCLRLGLSREEIARRAALLEIGLLRSASAAGCLSERIVGEPSALIAAARNEADNIFAHPAKKRISAEEWDEPRGLAVPPRRPIRAALELARQTHPGPVGSGASRHGRGDRRLRGRSARKRGPGGTRHSIRRAYAKCSGQHDLRRRILRAFFRGGGARDHLARGASKRIRASKSSGFSRRA